jgi:hypothetical protein
VNGLTSKQLVIAPGEEDEFAIFRDSLYGQFAPVGALEMGESLLDAPAKALDRLQRYASSNQRAYYAALNELLTVQTNRLPLATLEDRADPIPELVSIAQLSKRAGSTPGRMQNEAAGRPTTARPGVACPGDPEPLHRARQEPPRRTVVLL